MYHTHHTRLRHEELVPAQLKGAVIYGPENERISVVDHVHGTGDQAQVAFDIGTATGGSKRVALPANKLDFMRDESGSVHAVLTMPEAELDALPEHADMFPVD